MKCVRYIQDHDENVIGDVEIVNDVECIELLNAGLVVEIPSRGLGYAYQNRLYVSGNSRND